MQGLGLQVRITPQHLPVLVAGDQRNLFDREACFEQAAGPFVPQIMKVKIFDFQVMALTAKRSADGSAIVWENSSRAACSMGALFLNDRACVKPTHIEEGDALIVSVLAARVFAILDEKHSPFTVEICPIDTTDFVLAHRCRDRETDNAPQRNLLTWIGFECSDETIKFVLCWTPIALVALADETEPSESDARQVYTLRRENDAVDCRRVGEDRLDVAEIDSKRDRTGSFHCSLLAKLDQALTIEFR